jgi:4-amino-4-deoxy-L-arabinose transferase-like glycosyltransferase
LSLRTLVQAVPPWAAAVFAVGLAMRVGFMVLSEQPLLYNHQYTYFTNGLRIAEHPNPVSFVLSSDDWRMWDDQWTIAPLYYWFEAAVFGLFGPHLRALLLVQCLLGALTAVGVASLGRELAPRLGVLAGFAYAVHGYEVELASWTLTENLHTALFVAGIVVSLQSLSLNLPYFGLRRTAAGGVILGLSALARSLSSAFLPVMAVWRSWVADPVLRWRAPAVLLASAAAVILPWTARNVIVMGEPVPIETAGIENLWYANHLGTPEQFRRQLKAIREQATPADARALATHFALRGMRRHPDLFVDKVWGNFWHFVRPEGLNNLVRLERSHEPWRHAFTVLLEDTLFLASIPLLLVCAIAGRRTPAWGLVVLWMGYFVFMHVVVFLAEVPRHRASFTPFAFAAAAGGLELLVDPRSRRRVVVWLGLWIGLVIVLAAVRPYVGPALRGLAAAYALRPAKAAVASGDLAAAEVLAARAAGRAPTSARPWLVHGRTLAARGHVAEAVLAYERGAERAAPVNWSAAVALPRLLAEAGRPADAAEALRRLDRLSWDADPWLVLEAAWRELPPPRTNEIRLAQGDYGAVRGFFHPRGIDPEIFRHRREWNRYGPDDPPRPPGPHRWTTRHASLRLVPTHSTADYTIVIEMGSPFPSTLESPVVFARVNDGPPVRFTLTREMRPYTFFTTVVPGEPLVVRLESPTWSRAGEPADQGVRVDRLSVSPGPDAH